MGASRRNRQKEGGPKGFRRDLVDTLSKLNKRTSAGHKRMLLLLILAGTVLRVVPLFAAVTYAEALAYIRYEHGSWLAILTDRSIMENHILHTLLVKLSTVLFGVSAVSVRLPDLVAGVLCMPLFYIFVRAMFNRYIALMAVALVAGSGPLIEVSALSEGYAVIWLFFMMALLLGRHLIKSNDLFTALLLGVVNALGMWVDPSMIHVTVLVYTWLAVYLGGKYNSSLASRMYRWAASLLVFALVTLLLYAPVIIAHGIGQAFAHSVAGEQRGWEILQQTHQDSAFALWIYFNDAAAWPVSLLGFIGIVVAVYLSARYRALVLGLLVGAIPLCILQAMVPPPKVWTYALFLLHLGSAIALFYLLKYVQEQFFPKFSKRLRTALAALAMLLLMAGLGMPGIEEHRERFPDAGDAARKLHRLMGPADVVIAEHPWDAPLQFELIAADTPRRLYRIGDPLPPGKQLFLLVGQGDGQTYSAILEHFRVPATQLTGVEKVSDQKRLEIFAARIRTEGSTSPTVEEPSAEPE